MPQIHIKNARISFPDLFEAKSYKGGKLSYSAKLLIEPNSANDKAVRAAIKEASAEKFGKKADAIVEKHKTNNMKMCYVEGNLDNQDEHDGFMVLTAKRAEKKGRPTVIDGQRNPLAASDGKPYAGCYVNAIVDIYCQDGEFEGIRCGLGGVQFAKDGDAFAGGTTTKADDFEDIGDGADADDLE